MPNYTDGLSRIVYDDATVTYDDIAVVYDGQLIATLQQPEKTKKNKRVEDYLGIGTPLAYK